MRSVSTRDVGRLRLGAALFALTAAACTPLPVVPNVGGPDDGPVAREGIANTRELVWVTRRGTLRIQSSRVCREDGPSGGACVRLSATDRGELDRFFGAHTFRQRWDAYQPCASSRFVDDSIVFQVTFADGHSVGKTLDRTPDVPTNPSCDRATRNTVAEIGTSLVDRYFQ